MNLSEAKAWAEAVAYRNFSENQDDIAQEILIQYWKESEKTDEEGLRRFRAKSRGMALAMGQSNFTGAQEYRHFSVKALGVPEFPDWMAPTIEVSDDGVYPQVLEAVRALPPKQRAYVFMKYWLNLPTEIIKDRLGKSYGMLWRGKGQARDRLKEALSGIDLG